LSTVKKSATAVLIMIVSLSLSLWCYPSFAFAETAAEKQAEARVAARTLSTLQAELDAVSDVYFGALNDKAAAEAQIEESQKQIAEAEKKISGLQQRISTRAKAMYKTGTSSILDLLFGATTFSEFANNWDLLTQMSANDADLISQTKALRDSITMQQKVYEEAIKTAQEKALSIVDAYNKANSLAAAARSTYNSLSAEAQALYNAEQAAEADKYRQQAIDDYNNSSSGGTHQYYDPSAGGDIVAAAYSRLGCDYEWAASGPDCFDCSGLVSWCYGYSYHAFTSSTLMNLPSVDDPQPGDVVVTSGHAAIYVGNGTIVHAKDYGYGVVEDSLSVMSRIGNYKIVRPSTAY